MKIINLNDNDKNFKTINNKLRNNIIKDFEKYGIIKFSNFSNSHKVAFNFINHFSL